MVGFSEYFESVIHQKPEWRKAFIDYDKIHAILLRLGLMTHEINVQYGPQAIANNNQNQNQNNNNNGTNSPPVAQTPSLTVPGRDLLFPSNLVYGNTQNINNNNNSNGSRTNTPGSRMNTAPPVSGVGPTKKTDFVFPSNVEAANNNNSLSLRTSTASPSSPTKPKLTNADGGTLFPRSATSGRPGNLRRSLNGKNGSAGSMHNLQDAETNNALNINKTPTSPGSPGSVYHRHKHDHDRRPGHEHDHENDSSFVERNQHENGNNNNDDDTDQAERIKFYDEHGNELDPLLTDPTPGTLARIKNNNSFRASRASGGGPFYKTQTGTVLNDGMVVEELFNTSGAEKAQKIKQEGFDKLQDSSKIKPASMEDIARELWHLFKLREKAIQEETEQNMNNNAHHYSNHHHHHHHHHHHKTSLDREDSSNGGGTTNEASTSLTHHPGGDHHHQHHNQQHATPAHGSTSTTTTNLPASPMTHSNSQTNLFQLPVSEHNKNNNNSLVPPSSNNNNNRSSDQQQHGMGQREGSSTNGNVLYSPNIRTPLTSSEQPKTGGIFPVIKRDQIHATLQREASTRNLKREASNVNNNNQPGEPGSTTSISSSNNNGSALVTPPVASSKPCPVPLKFQKPQQQPKIDETTSGSNSLQTTSLLAPPASSSQQQQKQHNHHSHSSSTSCCDKGNKPSVHPLNLPPGMTATNSGAPYNEKSPGAYASYISPVTNESSNSGGNGGNKQQQQQPEKLTLHERRKKEYSNTMNSTPPMGSTSNNNNNGFSPLQNNNSRSPQLSRRPSASGLLYDRGPAGSPQQQQGGVGGSTNTKSTTTNSNSQNISMKTKSKFENVSSYSSAHGESSRNSPTEQNNNEGGPQFPPSSSSHQQGNNNNTNNLFDVPSKLQRFSSTASSSSKQNQPNHSQQLRSQQFQSGVGRISSKGDYGNLESPTITHQRHNSTCSSSNNNYDPLLSSSQHIGGSTNTSMKKHKNASRALSSDDGHQLVESFPVDDVTYIDVFNMCIDLIQQNAAKASHFAEVSQQQLVKYFTEHQAAWKDHSEDHDPNRAKTHLRYLHHELNSLSAFVEANKLCVIKLVREFQSATDHLIIDDEEELLLAEEPDEVFETLRLEACEDVILASIREVEAFFALMFCGGDINNSKKLIQSKVKSPKQAFRAGFFVAACLATLLYWLHVFFELGVTSDTKSHFMQALPVIRFCHVLALAFVCWSGVLWVFETYSINYLYVFELDNVLSVTWLQLLEYSLFMSWFVLLCGVLYVRSSSDGQYYSTSSGFTSWTPAFIPLMFFLFLLMIAFPIRRVMRERTRNSFFTVLWACMQMPFGYVTFVQFFVADWGTSLPTTMGDLLYSLCYFGTYFKNITHGTTLPDMEHCVDLRSHWGNAIAMIPYYWRACQTLKMYLRTENKVHLTNHGKYLSCLIAMTFETVVTFWPENEGLQAATWFWHIFSQLYCWVWDILMDWGWIKLRDRKMLLPKECHWAYWTAMVVDFIARMWFTVGYTKVQPHIGGDWLNVLVGDIEVARRAMWSVFRVENENTNNLETYRSIDFVPKVSLPPMDVFF